MLDFIRREKIYIGMIFFILALSFFYSGHKGKTSIDAKKSLSQMSFKEMALTETEVKAFLGSSKTIARIVRCAIVLGFFIFLASLIVNVVFIFKGAQIDFKALDSAGIAPWMISDIIRASIVIVFTGYFIGMIEGVMFRALKLNVSMGSNLSMMLNTFFIDVSVVIVVFYFVMAKYHEGISALGLKLTYLLRNIASGITAYVFIIPLLLVALVLSIWILDIFGYSPPPQPIFEMFMEEKRSGILLFLTMFISILGPVIEEIFFRGFMYSAMKRRLGILGAALISASIFSLLHTNLAVFLPILILGVLMAYLYEKTGSLVASITVHIAHNSVMLGFMFLIKELLS